ncbi:uncharacterized protein N7483_008855 [Penicillium malachiteum]|uniref:uncharacterized protein n=1 Tax=Penicillium malachiteum TaxID=1324776 RepID=UPI00254855B5|nr:uncharacterized protein N7483_008855 [Penicillium malachiteum]KAJ5720921.1 hypothetical protein N7483_008855 [Penicillium malachiteum]
MATPMTTPSRLLPQVQHIQETSPYSDIYTNAPISPLRSRVNTQHLLDMLPHAHPDPVRWVNPGGWGARHINDMAPFTLWDKENREFRYPTEENWRWIETKFGEGKSHYSGWFLCVETACPPQPIPLTLGTMPVLFVPPGEMFTDSIPTSGYSNPRIPDPCPNIRWPRMSNPADSQTTTVLEAIAQFANIRGAIFLPMWIVFELETGDDLTYPEQSLPGVVAGRTALYHHRDTPFHATIKSLTRPRLIDPSKTQRDTHIPQDDSNYLQQQYVLTPGCRVESGFGLPGTQTESINAATTLGIQLCRGEEDVVTVSHHGFLTSGEVYHPNTDGELIGTVVDTRPELDISLVTLTPASSRSFTNSCYFQAEPSTQLLVTNQIKQGSWSEADGMSSGFFSLMNIGIDPMRPKRPIGHPEISFSKWDTRSVNLIFGNVNNTISDGVCGAPIVDIETGGVAGFFHLTNGTFAFCACLDDLVAEGWILKYPRRSQPFP